MEIKGDEDVATGIHQKLFHVNNVYFYQIPPAMSSTLEPRASSWNPERPFMTGSLSIVQQDTTALIQLYEPPHLTLDLILLAQASISLTKSNQELKTVVQDVVDSSRYFVIRVEDIKTTRHAFLGIGFPDRADAFTFKATLHDFIKGQVRAYKASHMPSEQKERYRLGKGEMIHITLEKKVKKERRKSREDQGCRLLPPPSVQSLPSIPPPDTVVQEDEWGEFS